MSKNPDTRPCGPLVIALHCSGASGHQWRHLTGALGGPFAVVAPNLIGTAARGHWSGDRPFTLSEEAAHVVDVIDRHAGPVHLVGHSYGVASRCAPRASGRPASPACRCTSRPCSMC